MTSAGQLVSHIQTNMCNTEMGIGLGTFVRSLTALLKLRSAKSNEE